MKLAVSINDIFKVIGFLTTLYGAFLLEPGIMFILLGFYLILLTINFKELFNIIVAVPLFGDSNNLSQEVIKTMNDNMDKIIGPPFKDDEPEK